VSVADYYDRAALAAAQALGGAFEGTRFRALLEETPVGVTFDENAARSHEGRALLELTIRLLARLYPVVQLDPGSGAEAYGEELRALAKGINPNVTFTEARATVGVVVGSPATRYNATIFAGSNGWDAFVATTGPVPLGRSALPFGAGAAACIACGNIFRRVFMQGGATSSDRELSFSTFELASGTTTVNWELPRRISEEGVLVGVGAVGNAAAWALCKIPSEGTLHLVDGEDVDLGNLQRYVLTGRANAGSEKVSLAASFFKQGLTSEPHRQSWAQFARDNGYVWPRVLLALDSAAERRRVQASLPRWIANAWTQPGDLGVSVHPGFVSDGACVSCLYLQEQRLRNEDELVAEALRIPERVLQVRQLLVTGEGLAAPFLELVAQRLQRPAELFQRFVGQSIRELYVVGLCGGAVLPLGEAGVPNPDVHVPLAHQSALAGILLGATYVRSLSGAPIPHTAIARVDMLRPLGRVELQLAKKRADGRCICEDPDYRAAYERKWLKAK
jgi:hypothetical protein